MPDFSAGASPSPASSSAKDGKTPSPLSAGVQRPTAFNCSPVPLHQEDLSITSSVKSPKSSMWTPTNSRTCLEKSPLASSMKPMLSSESTMSSARSGRPSSAWSPKESSPSKELSYSSIAGSKVSPSEVTPSRDLSNSDSERRTVGHCSSDSDAKPRLPWGVKRSVNNSRQTRPAFDLHSCPNDLPGQQSAQHRSDGERVRSFAKVLNSLCIFLPSSVSSSMLAHVAYLDGIFYHYLDPCCKISCVHPSTCALVAYSCAKFFSCRGKLA